MSKFCRKHCHEQSLEDLQARLADLDARPTLTPKLQEERARVKSHVEAKSDERARTAQLPRD